MEARLETLARLLTALEDLVVQETELIRTMDFIEAVEVRERSAPVVERLCELASALPGPETGDPVARELRNRLTGLLDRCGQNHHFLEAQLARLQSELDRVTEARGRLRNVAPAYGAYAASPKLAGQSRLNTAA